MKAVSAAANGNASASASEPLAVLLGRGAIVGYRSLVDATAARPVPIWFDGVEQDSLAEIAGPSGDGKTTLATLLTVALANPTTVPVELLGRPVTPVAAGHFVIFIQEENGKWSVRSKLEAACEALGLPIAATIDRIVLLVRRGVVMEDETWTAIEKLGCMGKVGALFVDSRARVLRNGESNREEDQARVANVLHRMVQVCHAPVFVVSHTRKGEKGAAPSAIEDVSGSAQRGAGADVLLIVTARKNENGKVQSSTVKFAKLREAVDEHPEPVSFTLAKGSSGHWELTTSAVAPRTRDSRTTGERLADLLERAGPQGLTKTKIRSELGLNERAFNKVITEPIRQRLVVEREGLAHGKLCVFYALGAAQ